MSSSFTLTPVRVVRDRVRPLSDLPQFRCHSSDILQFVDAIERARGEETREFVWVSDTYSPDEADELEDDAADYCVRPRTITSALARFERHYAKAPGEYPAYYEAEAVETATGRPYWPEVRPLIDGEIYRLSVGVGHCALVPVADRKDVRKRRPLEPGEYEWRSITTGPTLVRVRITRRSIAERFEPLCRDLRACAESAAQARAQLLPETVL